MSIRIINDGSVLLVINVWETVTPASEGRNVERYDLLPGETSQAIEVRSWSRGVTVLEAAPVEGNPPLGTSPVSQIPVDRNQRTLVDGSPVTDDHRELKDNGQQKGYVVLSEEERAKGFIRPVRRSYTHNTCSSDTRMSDTIAETYARDPGFYSGTFCVQCRGHFPLDQFVWAGTQERVGS